MSESLPIRQAGPRATQMFPVLSPKHLDLVRRFGADATKTLIFASVELGETMT